MKDIIKLQSRGCKNYLKRLKPLNEESNSNVYVIKSESDFMRVGNLEDGSMYIDPSGGPMIIENHKLKEADAVVKKILFKENVGYIIIF
jgi:hypothetical protein